ncbi:MAG: hypothetical protein R2716_02150 [Microthrixaceae bacterium]
MLFAQDTVWHFWLAVPLAALAVLAVVAIVALYFFKVTRPATPGTRPEPHARGGLPDRGTPRGGLLRAGRDGRLGARRARRAASPGPRSSRSPTTPRAWRRTSRG